MTVEQVRQRLVERAQGLSRQIGETNDRLKIAMLGEDLERTVQELRRIEREEAAAAEG